MQIRKAVPEDIPEIINVLIESLGQNDLPVSEEIWKFKHINNPFGESLVLVAEEMEKIIGVRAFMCWQWHQGEVDFFAYRAVDTATHPQHQGKGIFKKLTLEAVEIAKKEGSHFIFNTPNDKSRPGYLKMGWSNAGKIEVALKPSLGYFWNLTPLKRNLRKNEETLVSANDISKLCEEWNAQQTIKSRLFTPKSKEYLEWRFEKNPLQKYNTYVSSRVYLAAYVKQRKGLKELRISECIFISDRDLNELQKVIKQWSIKHGVQVISFSPKLLNLNKPYIKGNIGPILTVRNLNLRSGKNESLLNMENWAYSLGDLELF